MKGIKMNEETPLILTGMEVDMMEDALSSHLDLAVEHLLCPMPTLDLLAEELRLGQNCLNQITGEFSSDDLLGVIFSQFCIGK